MVDQLRSVASEVTRVAREVGTEGKLGDAGFDIHLVKPVEIERLTEVLAQAADRPARTRDDSRPRP